MKEFFKINIDPSDLPALVTIKPNTNQYSWFEEISSLNQDKLARWLFENAFSELAA